jgi:hypothetical protein
MRALTRVHASTRTAGLALRAAARACADRVPAHKTGRTIACLMFLALAPYAIPGAKTYRVLLPASVSRGLSAPEPEIATAGAPQTAGRAVETGGLVRSGTPGEIEDPSGRALDGFFRSLLEAETGARCVRVCHYGDSPITNDDITATVRRRLQLRFGDAGHGFVLIAKPWPWYGHTGVTHEASRGWASDPISIHAGIAATAWAASVLRPAPRA